MNLSISNIAWTSEQDHKIYNLMKKYGFTGLEIAPTRIIPENPYSSEHIQKIKEWSESIKTQWGFCVPSMQSIWYGRQEQIFGTKQERDILIEYTKKAIDFAKAGNINNLVFGCPKNRNIPDMSREKEAYLQSIEFFHTLGEYALKQNTVVGMEANPPIYNTNFINDTKSALELIKSVKSKGFLLNLDVGTMIENKEPVEVLQGYAGLINHVHISEPGLKPINQNNRSLHQELAGFLQENHYQGFISIEMGRCEDNERVLDECMAYVSEIFR